MRNKFCFFFVIVTSPHSGTCDTQVAPTMCSCSHVTPYFERFNDQHLDSWNGTPTAIDTCKTRWGEWMENRRSTYKMAIASLSNVQTWLVFSLNSSALISFDSNACLSSRHRGACISYSVTPGGHKSKKKKKKKKISWWLFPIGRWKCKTGTWLTSESRLARFDQVGNGQQRLAQLHFPLQQFPEFVCSMNEELIQRPTAGGQRFDHPDSARRQLIAREIKAFLSAKRMHPPKLNDLAVRVCYLIKFEIECSAWWTCRLGLASGKTWKFESWLQESTYLGSVSRM